MADPAPRILPYQATPAPLSHTHTHTLQQTAEQLALGERIEAAEARAAEEESARARAAKERKRSGRGGVREGKGRGLYDGSTAGVEEGFVAAEEAPGGGYQSSMGGGGGLGPLFNSAGFNFDSDRIESTGLHDKREQRERRERAPRDKEQGRGERQEGGRSFGGEEQGAGGGLSGWFESLGDLGAAADGGWFGAGMGTWVGFSSLYTRVPLLHIDLAAPTCFQACKPFPVLPATTHAPPYSHFTQQRPC